MIAGVFVTDSQVVDWAFWVAPSVQQGFLTALDLVLEKESDQQTAIVD